MSWLKRNKTRVPEGAAGAQGTPAVQGTKLPVWLSANRMLTFLYVLSVLGIGLRVPPPERNVHYSAGRQLCENTRLVAEHLVLPKHVPLEAVYRLRKEKNALVGGYLRRTVKAGETLNVEDVGPWPKIEGDEAIPVEVDTEPDWLLLNKGSVVEVWVGDAEDPIRASVLAVVPSGTKWQVLLDRSDVPDGFGYPKDQLKLRILSLP